MVGHGSICAFDEQTDMRDVAAPPAALRRARELRQVLPLPDRAAPRPRQFAADAPVDRASFEQLLEALELGSLCAHGQRHAGADRAACWPTSPTSWGSHDAPSPSTATEVEVARGPTILSAATAAGAGCRRCASTSARRRSAPAASAWSASRARRSRCPPAPRRAATAWRSTPPTQPRAASPRAVVELVLSELPERARAAHRAGRRSRTASRSSTGSRAGPAPPTRRPRRPPSLPRLPARAVHLLWTLRARLRRGPGGLRAHRHRPRLPSEHHGRPRQRLRATPAASRAAPAPTPAPPTRSPRSAAGRHARRYR